MFLGMVLSRSRPAIGVAWRQPRPSRDHYQARRAAWRVGV